MNDDVLMAHLVLSIPLVTGVAQVASAMTRWPRRFPAEPAQRLELSRLLLPKALKALAGTALVDLSTAGILGMLAPVLTLPMFASGALMVGAMLALPPSTTGPWRGVTPARALACVTWARRLTLGTAILAAGSVATGRLTWEAFVVMVALLFVAGALRHWASIAVAELEREEDPGAAATG